MPEDNDLYVFEIAVADFDLTLIPEAARTPGSKKFESAVKGFYEDQLRRVADTHNVAIEGGKIRVTWRKDSIRPDAREEAVAALQKGDYASGVQILEFRCRRGRMMPRSTTTLGWRIAILANSIRQSTTCNEH